MGENSIWTDEWESDDDWSGGGGEAKGLPRGEQIGATLLRGRPTLRTPDGERQLDEGAVVHFPVGPDGTHGLKNETDELVRYVMVSSQRSPEVAEYPDLGQITAQARTGSQTGDRLWLIHDASPSAE